MGPIHAHNLCTHCNAEQIVYARGMCTNCYEKDRIQRKIENNDFCVQCIEKGKKKPVRARGLCRACNTECRRQRMLENILSLTDDKLCSRCKENGKKTIRS